MYRNGWPLIYIDFAFGLVNRKRLEIRGIPLHRGNRMCADHRDIVTITILGKYSERRSSFRLVFDLAILEMETEQPAVQKTGKEP